MTTLKEALETIIDESQRLDPDAFADALSAAVDELTTGERSDDLYLEAIADGIRFGAHAAVTVELAGGAMLRVILPDGARITHEWADRHAADPLINAALQSLHSARVTAENTGEDE